MSWTRTARRSGRGLGVLGARAWLWIGTARRSRRGPRAARPDARISTANLPRPALRPRARISTGTARRRARGRRTPRSRRVRGEPARGPPFRTATSAAGAERSCPAGGRPVLRRIRKSLPDTPPRTPRTPPQDARRSMRPLVLIGSRAGLLGLIGRWVRLLVLIGCRAALLGLIARRARSLALTGRRTRQPALIGHRARSPPAGRCHPCAGWTPVPPPGARRTGRSKRSAAAVARSGGRPGASAGPTGVCASRCR
jgi:hypothetical protein